MLRNIRTGMTVLTLCLCVAAAAAQQASAPAIPAHPRELTFKPLEFQRPKPERHVLKNGMVVFLIEDHDLPIVTGEMKIRTGRIYDPEEKVGLAELTGTVLRTGGAGSMSGDEIDRKLETLGATLESAIGTQEGTIAFWSMSKDLDETMPILAAVLRQPQFAQDKVDLKKQQMVEAVRRQWDEPEQVVSREFQRLVYASSPPWGRTPTLETLKAVSREDAAAFHQKFYHPNMIIAGFAGDFNSNEFLARLEKLFGDWPRVEVELPKLPPVAEVTEPAVNYVFKDIPQTYIQLGHIGMRRHDPMRYAAALMNYILGTGGFTSRLMAQVRTERGLAYSVGANLAEGTDRGTFESWVQTKSESTWEAIDLIMDIIRRMATDPISDEELDKAKSAIINQFVFRFENPQDTIRQFVMLEYNGFPEDYLDKYIGRIQAVTKEDIQAVAKKFLHAEQTIIVLVGNKELFGKPTKEYGPFREIQAPVLK